MAAERAWADAYLAQARADLGAAMLVGAGEPSVFAMLMQMAFEKLAKAALLRSGTMTVDAARSNHRAAARMVATMRRQRRLLAPLGGPERWREAFEVVEALERAQPQIAKASGGGPQLEYPWETTAGMIQWPARDLDIAGRLGNPKSNLAAHLSDFAGKLERNFDTIFE